MMSYVHHQFHYLITNAVSCRPVNLIFLDHDAERNPPDHLNDLQEDEDYELYDWNREPTPQEIKACKSHIDELIETWKPHGVVYLGKIAQSYKSPKVPTGKTKKVARGTKMIEVPIVKEVPTVNLMHPAFIARMEYKLIPVLEQSRLLDNFINAIYRQLMEENE